MRNGTRWLAMAGALVVFVAGCATKQPQTDPGSAQAAPTPAQAQPKVSFLAKVSSATFGWVDKLFPKKKEPPKAQAAQSVGTVRLVNKEEGFVLIDTISSQGAATGDFLVCIMNQKQTATLRISAFRNPPFLIADILSGEPTKDDRVYKP